MIVRRGEWSERLSALVLVLAALAVAGWSHARIAATEAAIDARERELRQLAAPEHQRGACSAQRDAEEPRPLPAAVGRR